MPQGLSNHRFCLIIQPGWIRVDPGGSIWMHVSNSVQRVSYEGGGASSQEARRSNSRNWQYLEHLKTSYATLAGEHILSDLSILWRSSPFCAVVWRSILDQCGMGRVWFQGALRQHPQQPHPQTLDQVLLQRHSLPMFWHVLAVCFLKHVDTCFSNVLFANVLLVWESGRGKFSLRCKLQALGCFGFWGCS